MKHSNLLLDYSLTAFYSILAVHGACVGISDFPASLVLSSLIVMGTLISYMINKNKVSQRIENNSGIAYALAAATALFFVVPLNKMLPNGGFPKELMPAAIMCWFLALGSFMAWSEKRVALPGGAKPIAVWDGWHLGNL